MADKATCPECDLHSSLLHARGYCPNGCNKKVTITPSDFYVDCETCGWDASTDDERQAKQLAESHRCGDR